MTFKEQVSFVVIDKRMRKYNHQRLQHAWSLYLEKNTRLGEIELKKITLTDKVQDWIDEQKKLGKENDEIIGTYFVDGTTVTQITKSGSGKGFGLKTQFDCINLSEKVGVN